MADTTVTDKEQQVFWIHLSAYAVINAIFAGLNLYTQPEQIWFIWPLIGWGIGVAAHGLALYLKAKSSSHGALASEEARGFVTHLFVYIAVNLLLAFINLSSSPDALWFHWPLLGWGLGVFLHGLMISLRPEAPPAVAASPAPTSLSATSTSRRTRSKSGAKRGKKSPGRRAAKKG